MRVVILIVALLVAAASSAEAANLCVKSGGSDATAKAGLTYTAGNEAGSTCWATLGRAVWGSTTRSAPNTSEAGAAGDTVYVFGGTYDTTINLGARTATAYNTANDGTSGNPLVFRCVGVCTFTGAEIEGVLLGQGDNYVEWRADLSAGYRWVVPMCSEATSAGTDCPASGVVTAVADYPSVACINATGVVIEGFYITLVQPVTYLDNTNGVRLEGCVSSTIRNVRIRDIQYTSDSNHNRSCITIYHSNGNTVEHVDCANAESGIFFKDTATASPVLSGNIIRYNLLDDVGQCFVWSLVTAGSTSAANTIYGNVCRDSTFGVGFIGSTIDGAKSDIIANNLFYNLTMAGISWGAAGGLSGVRIDNNIWHTPATALAAMQAVTWPAASALDIEHNVYYNATTFYDGSDGSRTFASFNTAYPDANAASPLSVTSNPLIADVAGGDYRLCTAAGAPVAGCTGASPAAALGVDLLDLDGDLSTVDTIPAGVYVTGTEVIGLALGAGATVPDAPTIGTAVVGNARCTVTFTANGTGGSPITSYTVTSNPGSLTGTGSSSPITVTGLTNGQAYTFTATATNAEGTSVASSASNSCTPAATTTQGIRVNIRGIGEQDQAGAWRFTLEQVLEAPHGVPFPAR